MRLPVPPPRHKYLLLIPQIHLHWTFVEHVVIDAIDPALQCAEIAFHCVRRDRDAFFVAHVFAFRMVHLAVLVVLWS